MATFDTSDYANLDSIAHLPFIVGFAKQVLIFESFLESVVDTRALVLEVAEWLSEF